MNWVFPESGGAHSQGGEARIHTRRNHELAADESTDDPKAENSTSYPTDERSPCKMKRCQLGLKKSDNAGGGQARCVDGRLPQGSDLDPRLDPPYLEKDGSGAGKRPAEGEPHSSKMEGSWRSSPPRTGGRPKADSRRRRTARSSIGWTSNSKPTSNPTKGGYGKWRKCVERFTSEMHHSVGGKLERLRMGLAWRSTEGRA